MPLSRAKGQKGASPAALLVDRSTECAGDAPLESKRPALGADGWMLCGIERAERLLPQRKHVIRQDGKDDLHLRFRVVVEKNPGRLGSRLATPPSRDSRRFRRKAAEIRFMRQKLPSVHNATLLSPPYSIPCVASTRSHPFSLPGEGVSQTGQIRRSVGSIQHMS